MSMIMRPSNVGGLRRQRVETEVCSYPKCHQEVEIGRYTVRSRYSGKVLCGEHGADVGWTEGQRQQEMQERRDGLTAQLAASSRRTAFDESMARREAARASASASDWALLLRHKQASWAEVRAHGFEVRDILDAVEYEDRIDHTRWETRSVGQDDVGPTLCPSGLWQVRTPEGVGFYSDYETAALRASGMSLDEVRAFQDARSVTA